MKTAVFLTILIVTLPIYSQVIEVGSPGRFKQGDLDFGISANLGIGFSNININSTSERYYSYDTVFYKYNRSDSHRPLNLILSATIGYYIIDGLAFEPELDLNFIFDADASISLSGNISYNFNSPTEKSHPFIRLGYGVSNYYRGYSSWYEKDTESNSLDTKVFTVGAGYKLLTSSNFSMKVEINYKNFSHSTSRSGADEQGKYLSESEEDMDLVSLSFGFSVFL